MDPEVFDAGYVDIGRLVVFLNAEFDEEAYNLDSEVCINLYQRSMWHILQRKEF
jgi:hypothetical protein